MFTAMGMGGERDSCLGAWTARCAKELEVAFRAVGASFLKLFLEEFDWFWRCCSMVKFDMASRLAFALRFRNESTQWMLDASVSRVLVTNGWVSRRVALGLQEDKHWIHLAKLFCENAIKTDIPSRGDSLQAMKNEIQCLAADGGWQFRQRVCGCNVEHGRHMGGVLTPRRLPTQHFDTGTADAPDVRVSAMSRLLHDFRSHPIGGAMQRHVGASICSGQVR